MNAFLNNSYFPSSTALKFAFKATFSALLALYIAFLLDLGQPHWAATTALIVAQPQAGMVLSKGLTRLVGTVIGTALSVIIMGMFAQTPWIFLGIITIIILLTVAASTTLRNIWSYSFMMVGITVAITAIPMMDTPTAIFNYATERCMEISLGIIVSSLVFSLIWPVRTHQILINDADQTILLGFKSAIKSMQGEALDDAFVESLSNIVTVDAQREHAAFEGQSGKNSANAVLGMCQNVLHVLSLARGIYRDKQNLSPEQLIIIEPWINQAIDALEKGKRADINKVLKQLEPALQDMNLAHAESTHITLHRIYLLLKHARRARRFLQSARVGKSIKLKTESTLSQHKNYTLGFIFGLRSAAAFMSISFIWYLSGWTLINAVMPLAMSVILCNIFAGKENAEKISLLFCKASFYAVITALVISLYILPNANTFFMLAIALAIPIFACSMFALTPKYAIYASLPITFLMIIHPNNYELYSAEQLLNQSVGILLGSVIAAVSIHLIPVDMPYWHGKNMRKLILKDVITLIYRPLNHANTWFNTRMSDRLILLAKHKDLIENRAQYSWNNGVLALDLGDEIFFLRRIVRHHPELNPAAAQYFKALKSSLYETDSQQSLTLLKSATEKFNVAISELESQNQSMILMAATLQIQEIWQDWCQLNEQEITHGNS